MPSPSPNMATARSAAEQLSTSPEESNQLRVMVNSIARSYQPYTNLVAKLKPGLLEGRWGSILVDNRSARLPSIALKVVTARLAVGHHVQEPAFLHIAAGDPITSEEMHDQINNLSPTGRVLLFSEYVAKGHALARFGRAATLGCGLTFDVAAINSDSPNAHYERILADAVPGNDTHVYVGDNTPHTEEYHNPLFRRISGVEIQKSADGVKLIETAVPPNFQIVSTLALDTLGEGLYTEHFTTATSE